MRTVIAEFVGKPASLLGAGTKVTEQELKQINSELFSVDGHEFYLSDITYVKVFPNDQIIIVLN